MPLNTALTACHVPVTLQVTGTNCGSNAYIYDFNGDGSVRCRADRDTTKFARGSCTGDRHVVGINAAGSVVCSSYAVQRRVGSSCGGGYSIRAISSTGAVSCEKDDLGSLSTSTRKMWSGYCSYHSRGTGWATYCHNTQERDTMGSSYLTRSSESGDRLCVPPSCTCNRLCALCGSSRSRLHRCHGHLRHRDLQRPPGGPVPADLVFPGPRLRLEAHPNPCQRCAPRLPAPHWRLQPKSIHKPG